MRRATLVTILGLGLLGCGVEFDPSSEVKTLRVLGVQKSAPYAAPGEKVEMSMLWHDGSPDAPRPVQIAWFSGCYNPPGDLFLGCVEQLAANASSGGGGGSFGLPPGFEVGTGDRFSFTMPGDVISSRPPPAAPLPPYGLGFVFFAVCAGELGPAPAASQDQFPVACYDGGGKPLGPNDFIAGYSAVYAYDTLRNQNPIISGFRFNGVDVTPSCVGLACLTAPVNAPDCAAGAPCIDPCADDGEDSCPKYPIKPIIERESAEPDEVSAIAFGRDVSEQVWVRYYVDRGSLKSEVRLVNDALKGWNDDHGTEFRAPKKSGTLSIWAVVQDNRGGQEWVRLEVGVR